METLDRLRRVEELFHAALEFDERAAEAFLDEQCGGDELLRREAGRLVTCYRAGEGFLGRPAFELSASEIAARAFADEDDPAAVGWRIGPYRVVGEIGRGGMGAVYEAVREDGEYERRVAIKVVKRGMDTDFVLRRFRRERQLLADFDHPNIARLLDGGVTSDGRPYLVMERIEGRPLTTYADERGLSTAERLALFRTVCAAVEYAHRRKVVHRDLKPANILVNSEGIPKLLDFGVAKVLAAGPAAPTVEVTSTGSRLLTPEYASPEQLRGHAATEASDVYSLGLILYQLLAGRGPYRFDSRAPHEVLRVLGEHQPPPPPSRALAEAAARGDAAESVTPAPPHGRNAREVRGDLDRIVLMAIRLEPERRYHSVGDLSEDVRRHLANLPVAARCDTLAYRGAKLLARHRVSTLITLAVAIASLAVGLALGLFTEHERARPTVAVLPFTNSTTDPGTDYLADGITDSLIDNLSQLPGLRVPARDSVFRYKGRAADVREPASELGVETVLRGSVKSDGDGLAVGVELVDARRGEVIWGKLYSGTSADILTIQSAITEDVVRKLDLGAGTDRRAAARRRYTDNAEAYRLYLRGRYFWNRRDAASLRTGINYFRQAISKDPRYALAYAGLADSYGLLGIYGELAPREAAREARAMADEAIEIDPTLPEGHASLAATLWWYEWDWPGAERSFRRAIELNPNYATAHHWYGLYLAEMGRFDEALAEERRALALDPLSLIINADMGRVLFYARRYDESLEQYRRTAEMDPDFIAVIRDITLVYEVTGRWDEWFAAQEHIRWGDKPRLRRVYLSQGLRQYWRASLDALVCECPFEKAQIYARLGEKDRAFAMLEETYRAGEHEMAFLKVYPIFDPLRGDPRFDELLRRMRLAP